MRALVARLGPVDLSGVRVIAMDEFAIQRGHRYATIVVDVPTNRVLWIGRGRSRDEIRPFFTLLGPVGCARIEAVVMDMSPAYREEVRAHCPQAALVYDLFHVVAKYGREVIDRVRVDETNRLGRAAGRDRAILARRRVIKGTRWLLLRNREHVTNAADRVRLRELLAANRALFTVYVLKDDLKQLWRSSAIRPRPAASGRNGIGAPPAVASLRCAPSPDSSRHSLTASSTTAGIRSTRGCSKA